MAQQIGETEIRFHFILFYLQRRYRHIFDNIHSVSGWTCCIPGRISYASWRLFAIKVSVCHGVHCQSLDFNVSNHLANVLFLVFGRTAIEVTKYSSNTLTK